MPTRGYLECFCWNLGSMICRLQLRVFHLPLRKGYTNSFSVHLFCVFFPLSLGVAKKMQDTLPFHDLYMCFFVGRFHSHNAFRSRDLEVFPGHIPVWV